MSQPRRRFAGKTATLVSRPDGPAAHRGGPGPHRRHDAGAARPVHQRRHPARRRAHGLCRHAGRGRHLRQPARRQGHDDGGIEHQVHRLGQGRQHRHRREHAAAQGPHDHGLADATSATTPASCAPWSRRRSWCSADASDGALRQLAVAAECRACRGRRHRSGRRQLRRRLRALARIAARRERPQRHHAAHGRWDAAGAEPGPLQCPHPCARVRRPRLPDARRRAVLQPLRRPAAVSRGPGDRRRGRSRPNGRHCVMPTCAPTRSAVCCGACAKTIATAASRAMRWSRCRTRAMPRAGGSWPRVTTSTPPRA